LSPYGLQAWAADRRCRPEDGGIGAVIFAGRQVSEARKSRDALIAAEFFWPPSSSGARTKTL
jgi:hypothetical protein